MAGTSYLPLVVEVAFGADPMDAGALTWTDVSAHVKRGTGLDFSRGWDTESDEPIPGRLTFTLNNDDGDFTPGATGAYGLVRNRLPVRVSAVVGTGTGHPLTYDDAVGWYDMLGATYDDTEIGTVVLWTGLVESWRITWESGVRPQVAVTAVDRWAAIRRLKFGPAPYETLMRTLGAQAYWPLTGEGPRGTAAVGDIDLISGATTDPQWQSWSLGDGSQMVTLTDGGTLTESQALTLGGSTGFTLAFWFRSEATTTVGLEKQVRMSCAGFDIYFRQAATFSKDLTVTLTDGTTTRNGNTGLGSVNADTVVHVALTVSVSGGTWTSVLYLNGSSASTASPPSASWGAVPTFTSVSAQQPKSISASGMDLSVGHVAVFGTPLTSGQVAALYSSLDMSTWAGETADVRAARLLTMVSPAPTLSTTGTFTSTMSKQSLPEKSVGEALMECAAAEGGTLHIGTDGWPVLTSRSWRTGNTLAFTVPARGLSSDVSWTLDDQQLCNSASVDRMVGDTSAGTVSTRDESSVTTYGEQPRSLTLWLHTDAQALDRANAESHMFATAMPRSADLSVDLLTKAATIPAATLLAADVGDRIAVSGMPAEAPGETEFYVESVADRVTTTEWTRTFTVSPRLDYWVLQDATYGVIDSVYVLAY